MKILCFEIKYIGFELDETTPEIVEHRDEPAIIATGTHALKSGDEFELIRLSGSDAWRDDGLEGKRFIVSSVGKHVVELFENTSNSCHPGCFRHGFEFKKTSIKTSLMNQSKF